MTKIFIEIIIMFMQDILPERILIVSITQIWPIIYFYFFAYNLLKRNRNPLTKSLGIFFIINAVAFSFSFFSIFSISIIDIPIAFIFYLISYYFFTFSPGILVIFSYLILQPDKKFKSGKFHLTIIFYILAASYVFWIGIFFNGINYNSTTNWRPIFNWLFFGISGFYIIVFLLIPEILITINLTKLFKDTNIKNRISMFLISIYLEFIIVLLTTLYNTWIENSIFRTILPIFNLLAGSLAAILLYLSFGKIKT